MTKKHRWQLAVVVAVAGGLMIRADSLPANPAEADSSVPAPRAALRGKEVYRSAFENGAGENWSKKQVTKCPSGRREFLGPFATECATLSLGNLPEHARVRLSFDLMIIMTWDGDAHLGETDPTGPDVFDATVDRGPRLVHASFVARPASLNTTQSFPGRFPYDHLPGGTAALEGRSLGYHYAGGGGDGLPDDYVYHIERSFAHSGKQLTIAFSGIHLQEVTDECWGLDNVQVEILPASKPGKLDEAAFAKLWIALGSTDPKKFVPAIDALIDLGEPGVAAIRKRLAPLAATDLDQHIGTLIAKLDANAYMVREQATAELRELGAAAEPALRAARQKTLSLEVRVRIDKLLGSLKEEENDASRRLRRVVEVFELVDGTQARAGLADIAGQAGRRAAWEAKAAIERLDGKAAIPTQLDLPPR